MLMIVEEGNVRIQREAILAHLTTSYLRSF